MFSRKLISQSTGNYSDKINHLREEIERADAILIGAGAGLSTAAGLSHAGKRFDRYFSDFKEKYGIRDMYSGGFYPFNSLEEYWAWWSRHIWWNRYETETNNTYPKLLSLVQDKDYFVITTNVDHQFQRNGFDKKRLFYTQGDYGLFQCTKPCCQKTYDNREIVEKMIRQQKGMAVPTELIPYCPVCGEPMTINMRCDDTFVQDEGWYEAKQRYDDFIRRHKDLHILYLELGVGGNTPVWIKYPFWRFTAENPKAVYGCINVLEAVAPREIEKQSICIDSDIGSIIEKLV